MKRGLLLSALLLGSSALRAQEGSAVEENEFSQEFSFDQIDIEVWDREYGRPVYHDPSWLEVKMQEILGALGENPLLLEWYIVFLDYREWLVESAPYQAYEELVKRAHAFDAAMREAFLQARRD